MINLQATAAKFESVKFLLSQDEDGTLLEDTLYRNLVLFGADTVNQVLVFALKLLKCDMISGFLFMMISHFFSSHSVLKAHYKSQDNSRLLY